MVDAFTYTGLPSRVVFGTGTLARLPDEIAALGCSRAMILCTKEQSALAERCRALIGDRAAAIFAGAVMHTPTGVTDAALSRLCEVGADAVVSIGGGSTTGLGKALAIRSGVRHLVVPTTYAGSEATPILGETAGGTKTTRRDPRILPDAILYDVELTLSLPPGLSVTSGVNAMAHAVEAIYAQDRNPVTSQMAEGAIAAMATALPAIVADPANSAARAQALYGAWLAGVCLGTVGMALHHKLCHILGGAFDLPHADVHTILLPHVIAFNQDWLGPALAHLQRALRTEDPAGALWDLLAGLGAPRALRDIGCDRQAIAHVVDEALAKPYWNPRPLQREALQSMLERAWAGSPPQEQ